MRDSARASIKGSASRPAARRPRRHVAAPLFAAIAVAFALALPAVASADFPLTIETQGTGAGTVKCVVGVGPVEACDPEYPGGTELTLVPEANLGSEFIEWSGDCGPIGCELTMDQAHTAIATFDLEQGVAMFALSVKKTGTGTGTLQCEAEFVPAGPCQAEYPEGTEVAVLAEADPGSKFTGFSGDCSSLSCSLTMDDDKSVTANFDLEPASEFALTIVKAGSGSGTVLCEAQEGPEACKAKYPEGTELTLLPTANPGSKFVGFSGDCTGSSCALTMDKANSVTATFNLESTPESTLTITKAGAGSGAVKCKVNGGSAETCAASYANGTQLSLIAEAAVGSSFAGYSSGSGSASACSTSPCTFTITANSAVTATFNLVQRTLTITKAGTGSGAVKCKVNGGSAETCAASYAHGTELSLVATADAGSKFAGYSSGSGSASACSTSPCTFTITANSAVTATFDLDAGPGEFSLTITEAGTGTGVVQCEVDGGSEEDCASKYPEGTEVTLLAEPDPGSNFTGWSGSCSGSGLCSLTMNGPRSVTATFDLEPVTEFTLTVNLQGTGSGTVLCEAQEGPEACKAKYPEDTELTLLPTANAGSKFVGFSGACSGLTCEVTMSANRTVNVTFNAIPKFTLKVKKTGTGTGKVTSSPTGIDCGSDCEEAFEEGKEVTLSAIPDTGSEFVKWSGACTTSPCKVTMSAAKEVTAEFKLVQRTLTITKAGAGSGAVKCKVNGGSAETCAASYANGTQLSLIAEAAVGSSFAGYSSGSGSASACTTSPCSFTITANSGVTATFNLAGAKPKFTLKVKKTGTGTGKVTSSPTGIDCGSDCEGEFEEGKVVTLTQKADPDSEFVKWRGACFGTGACKVTMEEAEEVTAEFKLNQFPLTIEKTGTGTGKVTSSPTGIDCGSDCEEVYAEGKEITLTATADEGSAFDHWTGGGCSGTEPCVVTMTGVKKVKAVFNAFGQRTLTVVKAGSGSGTVTSAPKGIDCGAICTAGFNVGKKVTLIPVAATNSTFIGFTGACTGTTPCVVTMSEARTVTATFEADPEPEPTVGLVVVAGTAKVRNGVARLRVFCNGPSACEGELKLLLRIAPKRSVVIGKAPFKLLPGGSTTLKIQLSRRALAALEDRKALQARVIGTGIHAHVMRLRNVS